VADAASKTAVGQATIATVQTAFVVGGAVLKETGEAIDWAAHTEVGKTLIKGTGLALRETGKAIGAAIESDAGQATIQAAAAAGRLAAQAAANVSNNVSQFVEDVKIDPLKAALQVGMTATPAVVAANILNAGMELFEQKPAAKPAHFTVDQKALDGLEKAGWTKLMDKDGDGQIALNEVKAMFAKYNIKANEVDKDGNGVATAREISNAINAHLPKAAAAAGQGR
jgi:hypothetical protein